MADENDKIIERLLLLMNTQDPETALKLVEQVIGVGAQQSHFLTNLGVITLVIGPQGLGYYVTSPGMLEVSQGIEMAEQAVLDFQRVLLENRRRLSKMVVEEAADKNGLK